MASSRSARTLSTPLFDAASSSTTSSSRPLSMPRQLGQRLQGLPFSGCSQLTAREHERVMEQAKGEISELMSAAAEKLVLSSTSDAYDKFLDTAEERKDNG